MRLNIIKDNNLKDLEIRLPRRRLETLAAVIGEQEQIGEKTEVNLIVTDDERIQFLNKQFRQLDRTTDVLSFPFERDRRSDVIGEIYISGPRAKAQAAELRHSVADELIRLTCHGLFHILGYDHDTDSTAERMEARERDTLKALENGGNR